MADGEEYYDDGSYEATGEGYKFEALYDYQAQTETELSFSAGDEILVLSDAKEGWFNAIHNGINGYVPANYVVVKEERAQSKKEKAFAERRELKNLLDASVSQRKALQEQVDDLKKNNQTKTAFIDKYDSLAWEDNFCEIDALTILLELQKLTTIQKHYLDATRSLSETVSNLQTVLNREVKPPHPLDDIKQKVDGKIVEANQQYSASFEKLNISVRTRNELTPIIQTLLEKLQS